MSKAWAEHPSDASAVRDLCDSLRNSKPGEACAEVAGRLASNRGNTAEIWDAVHLAAAELSMRARGGSAIVGIHTVTSANALHHSYLMASDAKSRLLLLLQGVGWMAQFRTFAQTREESLRAVKITDLEPHAESAKPDEVLASSATDTDKAASQVLRLAGDLSARQAFLTAALRATIPTANEVHYYKYLAALIEDIPLVSPEWRPHLTAASLYYTKRPGDSAPEAMSRARKALASLTA
jgi:hypothetical protein